MALTAARRPARPPAAGTTTAPTPSGGRGLPPSDRRRDRRERQDDGHRRPPAPSRWRRSSARGRAAAARAGSGGRFLGERLDQVERGDEQQQAGQDEEDGVEPSRPPTARPPAATPATRTPDDPHQRPAQEALPVAPPDRVAERRRAQAQPGPPPRALGGQLAAQQDRPCGGPGPRPRSASRRPAAARRRAASRARPPIPSRPTARQRRASADPDAPPADRSAPCWSGNVARSPSIVVGELVQPSARSAPTRRPGTSADALATPSRSRRPRGDHRARRARDGTSAPKSARQPIHSTARPGKRRKTKLPTTAPKIAPAITAMRSCASAAGRSAAPR